MMEESDSDSDYVVEEFIKPKKVRKPINDDSADILGNFDDEKRRDIEENYGNLPATMNANFFNEEESSSSEEEEDEHEEISDDKGKKLSTNQLEALLRGSNKTNRYVLYVTNLNFETTKDELKNHFESAGEVKCVRIPKNRKGCYAFVEMLSLESYHKAFSLHNSTLNGKCIKVQITEGGKKKSANKKNILKQKNRKLAEMRNESKTFNKSGKYFDKDIKKEKQKELALRSRWRKQSKKA